MTVQEKHDSTKHQHRELPSVSPHLVCANAVKAIDFYKKAFNAVEMMRLELPNGQLMHASLQFGKGMVMLTDEAPAWKSFSPLALKGTPVTIHLYVDDVDAAIARAEQAGATVVMPAADMFWGDRYGVLLDPFGHKWSLATPQRQMTLDEIKAAMAKLPPMGDCPSTSN